jgi:hypothetical protein
VARLAYDGASTFTLEHLPQPDAAAEIRAAVIREIEFYLIELEKPDPWAYALYHCGTASNIYSQVHWCFVRPGG